MNGIHDAHPHDPAGERREKETRSSQTPSALSEKQRRDLWRYIAVSIAAVELLTAVVAVVYGFMQSGAGERPRAFTFPWLYWAILAVVLPSLILLLVHFADVGLFVAHAGKNADEEWQRHLPERMQRLYRIIKGAPVAVILLGVIALGAGLATVEGALGLLTDFMGALKPYIPNLIAATAATFVIVSLAVVWLHYRTRKLVAEYQFRREVLEKTGVIIVDKGSAALPPGGVGDVPYAVVGAEDGDPPPVALPSAADPPQKTASEIIS
ncbi:MAG: hypothetical protein LBD42_09705 [Desulfovibrio sp.]|jgi:uncharacterized membrane protein|nr:hypothetical protein [Desulfovibrio sp.]